MSSPYRSIGTLLIEINTISYFSFSWEFEESEEDPVTSIPFQLQRLFVLLQTSKKRAIETTDVTRSFGWDSSEGEQLSELLYTAHFHQRSWLALI